MLGVQVLIEFKNVENLFSEDSAGSTTQRAAAGQG